MHPLDYLFSLAAVAQEEAADPMTTYAVYGVIGAFLVALMVMALRQKPADPESSSEVEPEAPGAERSAEEIEAEARRVFEIPHVEVNEGDAKSFPQVRIMRTEEEKAPITGQGAPESDDAQEASVQTPPEPPQDPLAESAGKTLREGLARTNAGFVQRLGRLFGGSKTIDDELLADLEEALFTADIGVRTSQKLVDSVHNALRGRELSDPERVWTQLKSEIRTMLESGSPAFETERASPFVIMVVGVNGAGKTTTIGKLASRFQAEGKSVLLAAGDTFRAAAVEQLEVWADRAGVGLVKGKERQDPSSVIYEACEQAARTDVDIVIADTAGRLQAKKELMDELQKVHRVIGKAVPGGPHEVWLVLDSTNGQNAISQAKEFLATVEVTGLVLTKLDGTAKGGVVIGISDEMNLPVRFIGIGEQVGDLRAFEPEAFADALFAE